MDRDKMAESIINLTVELLFWLTREDYTVVKKTSSERSQDPVSEGCERTLSPITGPPPRLIHEEIHTEKILELTNKMIELLTREVPIRCQDITVYFTMEEWEYLEGHKDLYKDVMMEDPQPLKPLVKEERQPPEICPSPLLPQDNEVDGDEGFKMEDHRPLTSPVKEERRTPERCPSPLLAQDASEEHHNVPQDDQVLYPGEDLNSIKATETYVRGKEQSTEDIPTDNRPGDCIGSSEEHVISSNFKANNHGTTADTYEEHVIISDIPLILNSKGPSSDTFKQVQISNSSQTVKQNKSLGRSEQQSTHSGEKPFSCSQCGKCFKRKSNLVQHDKIHTGEKPFSCSDCGKCFRASTNLLRHKRFHSGEKPFSCSECEKKFTQKSDLIKHRRIHTGEKPFSCSQCGKCFNQKCILVVHERIHTGVKPFSCSKCGKCFTEKSDLLRHERRHTGSKPFSCSECGKCFTQKSILVKHQKIHTGEKPFSCSKCRKCFTDKSHLVTHEQIHTVEKPFLCLECGKRFNLKSELVRHQSTHIGEKPYSCSDCGKCFNRKLNLERHQKIHTPREKPF